MGYYDDRKNAESYIKMAEGYDGGELIDILKAYLEPGSSVLELGMGPGTDFEILNKSYLVTGSDSAQPFLDLYREKDPSADLLLLDAVSIETERRFDCIYSNKVLYHLTRDELRSSLQRQADVLNERGILLHTFWVGEMDEQQHGLQMAYYTEETLVPLVGDEFEVLATSRYSEMEPDDSICLILRKSSSPNQLIREDS